MPQRSPRITIWWLGIIIFLALAAVLFYYDPAEGGARALARRATSWAIAPLHVLGSNWNRWGARLYERAVAFRENTELKEIQSRLLVEKAELLKLREENETLRSALKLREETQGVVTYAGVIGAFGEGREEYLILNSGSDAGVEEGAAVLSPDGILVGAVRTVSGKTSTARLFASASENLTVSILPAGINAVLEGDNSGEYIASLIPADAEVSVGDAVISAGVNEGIPAGIPVGMVAAVDRNDAGSFQDVRVKSPVEILFIDRVLVLTSKL